MFLVAVSGRGRQLVGVLIFVFWAFAHALCVGFFVSGNMGGLLQKGGYVDILISVLTGGVRKLNFQILFLLHFMAGLIFQLTFLTDKIFRIHFFRYRHESIFTRSTAFVAWAGDDDIIRIMLLAGRAAVGCHLRVRARWVVLDV